MWNICMLGSYCLMIMFKCAAFACSNFQLRKQIAVCAAMGKGGPRREKVPATDLSHLQDVLSEHVQAEGGFTFKGYHHQLKAQAILGGDLAENSTLMKRLMQVQPALLFRYADLKDVMGKIVQRFACVRDQFPMNQQDKAAAKVSNILMTLCTHTRRLRDQSRLREACSTLTSWQSSKLEELRDLMNNKEPSSPQKGKKAKSSSSAAMASKAQAEEPSTPKKAKKTKSRAKLDDGGEACSIASLDTVDAMEINFPSPRSQPMISRMRLTPALPSLPGRRPSRRTSRLAARRQSPRRPVP